MHIATGYVIWLTGLRASGKTTIAKSLAERLQGQGLPAKVLDSDSIRKMGFHYLGIETATT